MNFKISFLLTAFVFIQIKSIPVLFNKFSLLKNSINYISLCDLPTPIVKLHNFGNHVGCKNLYIKRDDLCGKNYGNGFRFYGGNKPRKLEFLLADAKQKGAKTIITYGCAGSNHASATAVYAKELGMNSILMLKNQPNSFVVRHNLLLDNYYSAQLKFFPNNKVRSDAAEEILKKDKYAYLIPTGGSTPIGALGFVNAAFELAEQIKNGQIKEPDFIYVATGSCATTSGLLLGCKAAGLKSKIIGICVEPEEEKDEFLLNIKKLFVSANELLNKADSSFEIFDFPGENLILNKKFVGAGYGLFIPETVDVVKLFKNLENIKLEGTYSVKPVVALIDDAASGIIKDQTILFWNTYCGIDFSYLTNYYDYKNLPVEFQKYFEEEVQPLAKILGS